MECGMEDSSRESTRAVCGRVISVVMGEIGGACLDFVGKREKPRPRFLILGKEASELEEVMD
jgi:hypothetical protein